MNKIYIAGPMRGYENYNFDAFDEAEAMLRSKGFITVSPAAMDRTYEGWGKYAPVDFVPDKEFVYKCMRRDLAAIFECQYIYLLESWEDSQGACAEYALAKCLGLKILYQSEERKSHETQSSKHAVGS